MMEEKNDFIDRPEFAKLRESVSSAKPLRNYEPVMLIESETGLVQRPIQTPESTFLGYSMPDERLLQGHLETGREWRRENS